MMVQLAISDLIGRFHPVVVHLPIGFLLLGALFVVLSKTAKFAMLKPAIATSFAVGTVAATLAVITGFVLSGSGDYDEDLLSSHQWMGYVTTVLSAAAWFVFSGNPVKVFRDYKVVPLACALIVVAAVAYTGHLGGSLTHGDDYLSMNTSVRPDAKRTHDMNQALVFRDVVQPILENKCASCHNNSKKKGKLSFASIEALLKGGKHGAVVKTGNVAESEMIRRINLPPDDKKFMPADEKPVLTVAEHRILTWWVQTGVSATDKKLMQQKLPDSIRADVAAFFTTTDTLGNMSANESALLEQFANVTLKTIDDQSIAALKSKGFAVRKIHYSPDLLDVRMLPVQDSAKASASSRLQALMFVKDQVIWLNLDKSGINDQDIKLLNAFVNLQRLTLSNNSITDRGLTMLNGLDHLQTINLTGTGVSAASIHQLSFKALHSVYAWRTGFKAGDTSAMTGKHFKVIGESN